MRSLSDEEQDLCQRILKGNGSNNFLSNIIDYRLDKACIELDVDNEKVRFLVETNEPQLPSEADTLFRRMKEVSVTIVTAINLLQMLEKDGYIIMYRSANNISKISRFGRCASNITKASHDFADLAISKLLIEYHSKEIITTQAFSEFCKRGYIARDEQRFKSQVTIATVAVCVSTLSCIFSASSLYKVLTSTTNETMLEHGASAVQQLTTLNTGLAVIERHGSAITGKVDSILTNQRRLQPATNPRGNTLKRKTPKSR